jgi:hypothetical protein
VFDDGSVEDYEGASWRAWQKVVNGNFPPPPVLVDLVLPLLDKTHKLAKRGGLDERERAWLRDLLDDLEALL